MTTSNRTEDESAATGNEKTGRRLIFTILKMLVALVLLYLLLRDANISEVFASIRQANPWLLLLAFSLHPLGIYVSVLRWLGLLRAQGHDSTVWYLTASYIVSIFFNNFLPSTIGGDSVRAYDSWRLGQTPSEAVALVFVDRFLGLLVLMLFALVAVLFPMKITEEAPVLFLWVGLGTFVVIAISWLIFVPSHWMPKLINRLSFLPQSIKNKLVIIIDAFLFFQGKRQVLLVALLWSILLQANVVVHYWLIAEAMALDVGLLDFLLITPLATFIMMIPISINAIGVRESVFVWFLSVFGATSAQGVAFAWIVYGMVLVQGVFGGIYYMFRR